ncbi:MAG: septum formation inhibitor Maf [Clostridia bacterium]|nr:septum formation inhibitor Maf [Clostridia bacterium]
MQQPFRLILASGSPRRRELLTQMGYKFEIIVPDVDENVSGHARDVVGILSRRKAEAVAKREDCGIIIASDTLVSLNGEALGKPQDENDAHRMLRMLSGETHEVFTGVTIIDAASGRNETQVVRTGVIFRELSDAEIWAYISTGEPMDKAGAYAIQGRAHGFVEGFEGSYENVIGFPVDEIREMLKRMHG